MAEKLRKRKCPWIQLIDVIDMKAKLDVINVIYITEKEET